MNGRLLAKIHRREGKRKSVKYFSVKEKKKEKKRGNNVNWHCIRKVAQCTSTPRLREMPCDTQESAGRELEAAGKNFASVQNIWTPRCHRERRPDTGSKGGHYCSMHPFKQAHRELREGELANTHQLSKHSSLQISELNFYWPLVCTFKHPEEVSRRTRRNSCTVSSPNGAKTSRPLPLTARTQTHPVKCHSASRWALRERRRRARSPHVTKLTFDPPKLFHSNCIWSKLLCISRAHTTTEFTCLNSHTLRFHFFF